MIINDLSNLLMSWTAYIGMIGELFYGPVRLYLTRAIFVLGCRQLSSTVNFLLNLLGDDENSICFDIFLLLSVQMLQSKFVYHQCKLVQSPQKVNTYLNHTNQL